MAMRPSVEDARPRKRAKERLAKQPLAKERPAHDGTRHVTSLADLREAVNACRRCDLYKHATQGVPGEGHLHAKLMFVGEQPGDQEDLAGHPFVGPAGAVLDRALQAAGIERDEILVTNAVKHFKFEQRGKRRLHAKPSIGEIKACHWWFEEELRLATPKLIVALGASGARAVLGKSVTIGEARGHAIPLPDGRHAWVTVHPSSLLRIPDEASRRAEFLRFVKDLKHAKAWAEQAT
jgi:uracil-DNA glycosylase family protein